MLAMAAGFSLAAPLAWAQQVPANSPFKMQGAPDNNPMLTTKGSGGAAPSANNGGSNLPWLQQQVPVAAPGTQAMPAAIPFGKSTASQYQPIPEGPHTATAVPVENIDSTVTTSEPAPPTPAPIGADPAHENPTDPTGLTAPIFKPEEPQIPRVAEVRVLNKVTARAQTIHLRPGTTQTVGKINLSVSHCQRSAEDSLPDAAALFEISENVPGEKQPKPLFSGWLYQSSPSITALEHPIYDVTLVACEDTGGKPKPTEKPAEKDKKSAK